MKRDIAYMNGWQYRSSKWFQLMLEHARFQYQTDSDCPFCEADIIERQHGLRSSICNNCPFKILSECVGAGRKLYHEMFEPEEERR